MKKVKKKVELPLVSPTYSTYHSAILSASISENLSIRNWYLNEVIQLDCCRDFLWGYTTPLLRVEGLYMTDNPYVEKVWYSTRFMKGSLNRIIKNMLDEGYYVYFSGVDDYYVKGKSWYKERHFSHDGAICGYNQEDKTFCIYAYDKNWVYKKFWTPQKCFNLGKKAIESKGIFGEICAVKAKDTKVDFNVDLALLNIAKYLDSNMEKYPVDGKGHVYGAAVHNYIAKYVDKLYDGSIPYERMDRRIFRLIWEHKCIMLERIECIEREFSIAGEVSTKYADLVKEADTMRMLYASHRLRRRDSVLPVIKNKLISLAENERILLNELIIKTRGAETS